MVLYAAADAPLPEIPEATPPKPLSVRPIRPIEEPVRVQFTKRHVSFLGAHGGCSCGFTYGIGGDEDDANRVSAQQLVAYVKAAVKRYGSIELYACWADEESEPVEHIETLTTDDLSADSEAFELRERWFATVLALNGRGDG